MITVTQLHDAFNIIPVGTKKAPNYARIKQINEGLGHGENNNKSEIFWKQKVDLSYFKNTKIGICCGVGGLEVLDIDNHFSDADDLLTYVRDNIDIERFPIIKTGGGGYHVYYYTNIHEPSTKLAMYENTPEAIAEGKPRYEAVYETRGLNSYVVFYNNIINGDLFNIPTITDEERENLFKICRTKDVRKLEPVVEYVAPTKVYSTPTNDRPGDAFENDNGTISEIKSLLKSHGWTELKNNLWRRPGKDEGVSAKFDGRHQNEFYVYSTNAYPFENARYSLYAVYTILEHQGDFKKAAKELANRYDIKPSKPHKQNAPLNQSEQLDQPILSEKWQALQDVLKEKSIRIRYNTLTKILDYCQNNGEWLNDVDILFGNLIFELENNRGVKSISKNKLHEMIMNELFCEIYDPIATWLESIPKWNGVDVIEKLCNYIEIEDGENRDYFNSMFKKHLIRTMRSALEPDFVNRNVFVLYGRQEIGKTKIWQWLTPKELYYDEPINLADKDSFLALARNLIINLDDLDTLSKREVTQLKAYISKGAITKRLPYARSETRMDRLCSFVASTNLSDILTDDSNTRWLIVKVKSFNWQAYIKEINAADIWAQAKALYLEKPENGDLTNDEKAERETRNNAQFLETSKERDILQKFFDKGDIETTEALTTTDIMNSIEKNLYPVKIDFKKLILELRRLFGAPIQTTYKGRSGRFYYLRQLFPNLLNSPTPTNYNEGNEPPF